MADEYQYMSAVGVVEAVTPRTTTTGKEYSLAKINGPDIVEVYVWDKAMAGIMEALIDQNVTVSCRKKKDSRYWTLSNVEPYDGEVPKQKPASPPSASRHAMNEDELRARCLDAASRLLAQQSAASGGIPMDWAEKTIKVAKLFELYVSGADNPNA